MRIKLTTFIVLVSISVFSCSPTYRSKRVERFFEVKGANSISSYSIFYRDYKDCEIFIKYTNTSGNAFNDMISNFGLTLDQGLHPVSPPPNGLWNVASLHEQVTSGNLSSRTFGGDKESIQKGYISSYEINSNIYLYATGWKSDILEVIEQAK